MEQHAERTTLTVVETVTDVLGTPHDELPPLSNAIDLDALDEAMTGEPAADVTVTFTYAGLRVTVFSQETAHARPVRGEDDASMDEFFCYG